MLMPMACEFVLRMRLRMRLELQLGLTSVVALVVTRSLESI